MFSPPKTYTSFKRPWPEELVSAIIEWVCGIFSRLPGTPARVTWILVNLTRILVIGEMGDIRVYILPLYMYIHHFPHCQDPGYFTQDPGNLGVAYW